MRNKCLQLIALLSLIFTIQLGSIRASANEVSESIIFGPQKFYRGFRRPKFQTVSFSSNPGDDFQLEITNANGLDVTRERCSGRWWKRWKCNYRNWYKRIEKRRRASRVEIELNGQLIVSGNEINRNVRELLKTIPLQAENTLKVKIKKIIYLIYTLPQVFRI